MNNDTDDQPSVPKEEENQAPQQQQEENVEPTAEAAPLVVEPSVPAPKQDPAAIFASSTYKKNLRADILGLFAELNSDQDSGPRDVAANRAEFGDNVYPLRAGLSDEEAKSTFEYRVSVIAPAARNGMEVVVIRNFAPTRIPCKEVVVGDILRLEVGNLVAADGVLIHEDVGGTVKVIMGCENGDVEKRSQNSWAERRITSGSVIESGAGLMLVLAVGAKTERGVENSKTQQKEGGKGGGCCCVVQ